MDEEAALVKLDCAIELVKSLVISITQSVNFKRQN